MIKKSKLFNIVLALVLVATPIISNGQVFAASNNVNDSTSVSIEEARNVAINQIVGDMQTSDNATWKTGVNISKITALFDLDNNPSAYLFELKDKQGNDNGYIVVSASKNENPIIEYSYQGQPFINTAKSVTQADSQKSHPGKKAKKDNIKLYYLGDLTYLDEVQLDDNTTQAFDISTSDYKDVNIDDIKKIKKDKKTDTQYSQLWDFVSKNHLKTQQSTGGSNPPDNSSTFITNPSLYESGYSSSSSKDCTGYNITYNVMSDFRNGGVCAPTAATNLCEYWRSRNYSKYHALEKSSGWQGTFNSFYSLMGTSSSTGTLDSKVSPAYINYFKQVGLSCSSSFTSGTNYGNYIVSALNNDSPCHLILHGNNMYGDHSVLALGYKQYVYTYAFGMIGKNSNYIRIEDGWISSPTRFVWAGCTGSWNYVTVNPN
jgi:hypothetical protein